MDQFSEVYSDWGKWQTVCFLLIGFAAIWSTCPTLIMTFMNAKIDFWCRRPDNVLGLSVGEWRSLSGTQEDNCQIFNLSYVEMTLEEAKRYDQLPQKEFHTRNLQEQFLAPGCN